MNEEQARIKALELAVEKLAADLRTLAALVFETGQRQAELNRSSHELMKEHEARLDLLSKPTLMVRGEVFDDPAFMDS